MNFALIMFVLIVLMGGVWLIDRFYLRSKRGAESKEPWWISYSKSFFPVILVVFLLRSFLIEPFKIPSGSMIPTLLVGDYILVNKYIYGIRLPIINIKLGEISHPKRGDVMVFRFPLDSSTDFIKRVIAIPGDKITYKNKQVFVNDQLARTVFVGDYEYVEGGLNYVTAQRMEETIDGLDHSILLDLGRPTIDLMAVKQSPFIENCVYNVEWFSCMVPPGQYFMLGDNRDHSHDSRYWGFVPDANIVGKAIVIWWNFDSMKRIGTAID